MINHHFSEATLLSYALGTLPAHFDILIECHLEQCAHCRQLLNQAEAIAGNLLDDTMPLPLSQTEAEEKLTAIFDQLDDELIHRQNTNDNRKENIQQQSEPALAAISPLNDILPQRLKNVLNADFAGSDWQFLAPGVRSIKLPYTPETKMQGSFRLLKIAPGVRIPEHTHTGNELTLVLKGSFSDEIGRFQIGDVAELDDENTHQPIADSTEECICLIATEAPLEFKTVLPKVFQQFVGI